MDEAVTHLVSAGVDRLYLRAGLRAIAASTVSRFRVSCRSAFRTAQR